MARLHPDKMSFLEHLEELRTRLIRSLIALVIAVGICWNWASQIFHFMTEPLRAAYPKIQFIYTEPTEAFMLYMKAAFFAGIFAAAPYVLYQVWAFISPGLYKHEKGYVVPFVLFGSVFFMIGAVFGHYFMFPATFRFLGAFAGEDMQFLPRVTEYFSFYFWFVLGLGVVFQIPVIIVVLSRIGLVTPRFLIRYFKYAVLVAFIVAAIITPTPDVVNQTMLALPMIGLYLVGVLVAWLFGRPRKAPQAETDTVSAEAQS
jgi:sec-independent protein translocase protein TatC